MSDSGPSAADQHEEVETSDGPVVTETPRRGIGDILKEIFLPVLPALDLRGVS